MARVRALALLGLLYFCQGLPGGFLAETLEPILLKEGVHLAFMSVLGVLSLPWALKLLWAPLVDRHGWARLGHRKSWMLPGLLGMLACTLAIGQHEPHEGLVLVCVLFFVLNLCAATQDIAVDGFAVTLMRGRDLGPANSAQVGGFKLGNLVGGGVLVMLLGTLGWQRAFAIMAACLALALFVLALTREPPETEPRPRDGIDVVRRAFRSLTAVPAYAAFLFAAKFAETAGGRLVTPAMVKQDFSLEQIGAIDGTAGAIATIVGAVLGGALVRRRGWAWTMMVMSCAQGLALVVIAIYQLGTVDLVGFGVLRAWEKLAGGGVAVAVFTLAMSRCTGAIASSQFTAAQTLYISGGFVAGGLAPLVASVVGIGAMMAIGGVLAMAVGVQSWRLRARIDAPATADPASDSRSA